MEDHACLEPHDGGLYASPYRQSSRVMIVLLTRSLKGRYIEKPEKPAYNPARRAHDTKDKSLYCPV
jgi:hypothetical protein